MGFAEQAALAEDAVFRTKVRIAMVIAAKDAVGEAPSAINTRGEKRHALAVEILRSGGTSHLDAFAWATAANPAVESSSPDDAIQYTVNQSFSDMAGVTAIEEAG